MDSVEYVRNAISIAVNIKKMYDAVKGNKEQCKMLNDQVQFVTSTLKNLPDGAKIQATVIPLIETLKDCLALIGEFQTKHWIKKWILHGSITEDFEDLFDQLARHQLNWTTELVVRLVKSLRRCISN